MSPANDVPKLLIGTGNPAKFARYRAMVNENPRVRAIPPTDLGLSLSISEDGVTAEENAQIKARAYRQESGLPTLAIDEALYIDALPDQEQPGLNVRRYLGEHATDEELLWAFTSLAKRIPPENRSVRWTYALCLALPDGRELTDVALLEAIMIDDPVLPIIPGYPLNSILLNPYFGKVHRNLSPIENRHRLSDVYAAVQKLVAQM